MYLYHCPPRMELKGNLECYMTPFGHANQEKLIDLGAIRYEMDLSFVKRYRGE